MSTYATDIFEGAGLTEFTLTFSYLSREHITVTRINADSSKTVLTVVTQGLPTGDEYIWKADNKIEVGTALAADQKLEIQRDTPENRQLVQWADGSYIVADDLNESDLQWLYNIQELEDQISAIDGTVVGEAVKEVFGAAPIQVDDYDKQLPIVSIDETKSTDDPNALTSDTKVLSEKAVDLAFSTDIGDGTSYPPTGATAKVGKLRINPNTTVPGFFYWSGTAWVQVSTKGEQGDQGPPGPAPGLQDPPATAVTVPLKEDGSLGDPTADVVQDPSTKDLRFLFGIPAGEKGDKGDTGADSTVPGPPPGLQGNAAVANNVANNPDGSIGQATASVTADANSDLQFTFGIPVGERGPIGPPGEGVDYKGMIDATSDAEPSPKANGDFYVNTGTGTSSWTGLTDVTQNDRLIWNANTSVWDRLTPPPVTGVDLSYVAAPGQGTVSNSAGTNAVLPAVDATNAGLMIPDQYTKLNGIEAGAEVNPNLDDYLQSGDNVSELNNDAGYITSADIPPQTTPTLQSVLDEGNTSTTQLWIGVDGQTAKLLPTGVIQASDSLRADNSALIGTNFNSGDQTGIVLSGTGLFSLIKRSGGGNLISATCVYEGTNRTFTVDADAKVTAHGFRIDQLSTLP